MTGGIASTGEAGVLESGRSRAARLRRRTGVRGMAFLACLGATALLLGPSTARALPRFALQEGKTCGSCHVNPTGGGLRTVYGIGTYSRRHLARATERTESLRHDGTVTSALRVGADFRFHVLMEQAGSEGEKRDRTGYETLESSLYASFEPVRGMHVYIRYDPRTGGHETYALLKNVWGPVYVKAGDFSPDFGLRLDDFTAYTRGGNREIFDNLPVGGLIFDQDVRDAGGEIGVVRRRWRLSAAYLNGNSGGPPLGGNKSGFTRLELRPRVAGVETMLGGSLFRQAGNQIHGFFGGFRLGRLTLLGELDYADSLALGHVYPDSASRANAGAETLAMMLEASVRILRGLHLVGRYEMWDPARAVPGESYKRIVAGMEIFPLPYLEIRPQLRFNQEPNSARIPAVRNDQWILQVHLWL